MEAYTCTEIINDLVAIAFSVLLNYMPMMQSSIVHIDNVNVHLSWNLTSCLYVQQTSADHGRCGLRITEVLLTEYLAIQYPHPSLSMSFLVFRKVLVTGSIKPQ